MRRNVTVLIEIDVNLPEMVVTSDVQTVFLAVYGLKWVSSTVERVWYGFTFLGTITENRQGKN
jgi:hypothetical protein